MTRQQAQQFISVYNALLTIATKGEDTKTMARVLETMEGLANAIEVKDDAPPVIEEKKEEE